VCLSEWVSEIDGKRLASLWYGMNQHATEPACFRIRQDNCSFDKECKKTSKPPHQSPVTPSWNCEECKIFLSVLVSTLTFHQCWIVSLCCPIWTGPLLLPVLIDHRKRASVLCVAFISQLHKEPYILYKWRLQEIFGRVVNKEPYIRCMWKRIKTLTTSTLLYHYI